MVTVLLLASDEWTALALSELLRGSRYRVVRAANLPLGETPPAGLVLLDLRCSNAAASIALVRSAMPGTPLLGVHAEPNGRDVALLLRAGGMGLVGTNLGAKALLDSLDLACAGSAILPSSLMPEGTPLLPLPPLLAEEAAEAKLTPRERQLLPYLAQGLSNKDMARRLGLAEGTVKVHLRALRQKIAARNRTQAAVWAADRDPGRSATSAPAN